MNFVSLFKAVDTLMAFRDAAKRFKGADPRPTEPNPPPPTAIQGLAGQIETRLTNVVVAALKEAFDRDHARLELERTHLEEERRRAEAALRLEMRRQAADRELARLRLLAGAAMVGWIASIAMLAVGLSSASINARIAIGIGWLLLLGALATAFNAQSRVGLAMPDNPAVAADSGGTIALWLLISGLAVTAVSLLL